MTALPLRSFSKKSPILVSTVDKMSKLSNEQILEELAISPVLVRVVALFREILDKCASNSELLVVLLHPNI